ncbi:MAG: hypothetical protein PVI57_23425 [Gemmatimonadota bacterium]
MSVTAQDLMSMSKSELDDLFRASPAGPVPEGRSRGTALVVPGSWVDRVVRTLIRAFWWRGKFFRKSENGSSLKNLISPLSLQLFEARVYPDESWFSPGEAVILDYSRSSFLVRKIRDEIRRVGEGLYLGQVFWGRRRLILFMLEFADGVRAMPRPGGP